MTYPSLSRDNNNANAKNFENSFKRKNKILPSLYATRGFDITFDTMLRLSQNKTYEEAAHKWQIDLGHSFVVSQKWQDAEVARHVGCTSLLLHSPWNGRSHHDFVMPDLAAAAGKILQLTASQQLAVA